MTTSLTFEQVLNQRVTYYSGLHNFTGVVRRPDPTSDAHAVLVSDADDRTYNVALSKITLVEAPKPSLEDELRVMVVRLEAGAQCCGDGAGGLARASAMAQNAAALRGLLTRHGHDCEPCKVYDNAEDALAAMASIDG